MRKGLNVLSLFDGMSCGRIALERADIPVANYLASEIDGYAVKVTQKNYPDTVQLGDITEIDFTKYTGDIDIVIGGSPCTYWSIAKTDRETTSEGIGFELFMEYARAIKEAKPSYFLYENNFGIHRDIQHEISKVLGVEPIKINSSLVSAQNRERLYWTNIPNVKQPEDRGIVLKDILLDDPELISEVMYGEYDSTGIKVSLPESGAVDRCYQVGVTREIKGFDVIKRVYSVEGKAPTLTTMQGGHREPKIAIDDKRWRKLHPIEIERLQTVPDGYTEGVSKTQRHKMLGNGWTVDVIAHILRHIPGT